MPPWSSETKLKLSHSRVWKLDAPGLLVQERIRHGGFGVDVWYG